MLRWSLGPKPSSLTLCGQAQLRALGRSITKCSDRSADRLRLESVGYGRHEHSADLTSKSLERFRSQASPDSSRALASRTRVSFGVLVGFGALEGFGDGICSRPEAMTHAVQKNVKASSLARQSTPPGQGVATTSAPVPASVAAQPCRLTASKRHL